MNSIRIRTFVYLIGLQLFSGVAQAQTPVYSNEFLAIGIGGRALGMANVSVASVNDVTAVYWNPAGLAGMDSRNQLGLMHTEYFAGIARYDYLGWSYAPDASSALGIALIRFGVDDIPNTLDLVDQDGNISYDRISLFSAADYGFLFSYGKKTGIEGLQVGGTVKLIYRRTGEFASAWGFGLDAGVQYRRGPWYFGASGRDITSTFNVWKIHTDKLEETFLLTGNDLPENSLEMTLPRLWLGAGRAFAISGKFKLYAEADLDLTFAGKRNVLIRSGVVNADPRLGMELSYAGLVHARAGIGNIQQVESFDGKSPWVVQPNIGLGITWKGFSIDYALTDVDASVAQYSHVFSLSYGFGKPEQHAGSPE